MVEFMSSLNLTKDQCYEFNLKRHSILFYYTITIYVKYHITLPKPIVKLVRLGGSPHQAARCSSLYHNHRYSAEKRRLRQGHSPDSDPLLKKFNKLNYITKKKYKKIQHYYFAENGKENYVGIPVAVGPPAVGLLAILLPFFPSW